jgi:microcystin-dependent protein
MEIADVIPSEPVLDLWGNAIRDRTVQRYDDVTTRTSENASPTDGDLAFMENDGNLEAYFSGAWRPFIPAGVIEFFAGTTVPPGWLACTGQAVSRTTYARLFGVVGTTYGSGDGSTTFNLPDLRQRFPLGKADSGTGSTLGSTGGSINHVHTGPSHTHSGPSHSHTNPTNSSSGSHGHVASNAIVSGSGLPFGNSGTVTEHTHTTTSSGTHTHAQGATGAAGTGSTGSSGTGNTGSNNPPYIALGAIVKT